MHGVMVNGMTGEGMTLRVEERKRLTEEWFKVTRKHQLTMLLNIGGTNIADVYDMAEHAEKLGVDGILVLPDLFFRPVVEEDLLSYIRDVSKYAPSIPILYYHIPFMTNIRCKYLNTNVFDCFCFFFVENLLVILIQILIFLWRNTVQMSRFYDLAEKEISNFGGIYYADGNLDTAAETWKAGREVIMAMGTVMLGTLATGFDAVSMTVMNIVPEWIVELHDHVLNYRWKEAAVVQGKIIKRVRDIWTNDEDLIVKMKMEFNKLNTGFKLGPTRKPKWTESMMNMRNM